MAFDFNGTNQHISATNSFEKPLTIYARFNVDTLNKYQQIVGFGQTPFSSVREFRVDNANKLQNAEYGGGIGYNVTTTQTVATATWYSGIGQFLSATSRKIKLGDNAIAENTSSLTTTVANLPYMNIAAIQTDTVATPFDGKICEVALWSSDLTADEMSSLVKGFSPRRIRPQSLVFYAPLLRNLQDVKGALALTNNNSATVADHPRVY